MKTDVRFRSYRDIVVKFLREYGMYYEDIKADEAFSGFLNAMEKGLSDNESSLQMIPTYINRNRNVLLEKTTIVIDIGGTNVRVATVFFDVGGRAHILDFSSYPTPGIEDEITYDEFFSVIARYLRPIINKSDSIGLCFSFATIPMANKDAKVVASGKQLKVKGLVGSMVAENLRNALKKEHLAYDKKIIVLNDVVSVILGGSAPDSGIKPGDIGFILGTGTNVCYVEKNSDIKKLHDINPSGQMIINVESGGYDGFKRGDIDVEFDNTLIDTGSDLCEKMVSGKYQGGLMQKVIQKAISRGLFTEGFANRFNGIDVLPSKEIDAFLKLPYAVGGLASCCGYGTEAEPGKDRLTLYYLIDAINRRSALLCAIILGAVSKKANVGCIPFSPASVIIEGSAYYRSENFREKLNHYVKSTLNKKWNIYLDFYKVEDVTLIGTAIASLNN